MNWISCSFVWYGTFGWRSIKDEKGLSFVDRVIITTKPRDVFSWTYNSERSLNIYGKVDLYVVYKSDFPKPCSDTEDNRTLDLFYYPQIILVNKLQK